jgi:hypothetical protein
MSVHSLHPVGAADAVQLAKVHLAASLRMAVADELEEGIDNHFTMKVPGREGSVCIGLKLGPAT